MTSDFNDGLSSDANSRDFTIVANVVARDPKLSFAAKGVFLNLVSHADGFPITEGLLVRQSADGVKTVRRLLVELRDAGYVYRSPERTRFPAGTRNDAGKDIGGALGPYRWFFTDKPEKVAANRARYAAENAGQHYRPSGEVVDSVSPVDNPDLAPHGAGSADQGEQGGRGVSAGRDNRPVTTVVTGSSKEDHFKNSDPETDGRTFEPTDEHHGLAVAIVRGLDLTRCDPSPKQHGQIVNAVASALGRGVAAPAVADHARRKAGEAKTCTYLVKAFSAEHLAVDAPAVTAPAAGEPCGQCDARTGDGIAARQTTDADGRAVKCSNCHPHAIGGAQ